MTTFTSTLPDDLLQSLAEKSKHLSLPKNKIIEQALRLYLEQLNKAEYIQSYKSMVKDTDIMILAEEGMDYYCREIAGE